MKTIDVLSISRLSALAIILSVSACSSDDKTSDTHGPRFDVKKPSNNQEEPSTQPIILNIQTAFPPSSARTLQQTWADNIAKTTDGEVNVKLLSKQVADKDTLTAVASGEISGHIAPLHYFGEVNPAYTFVGDMIAWQPEQMITFINSDTGFTMMQSIHGNQVTFLGGMTTGTESLISDKRIDSLEDFKGISIRTPEGLVDEVFKKLGASTVQLTFPKIKPAFESGEINATDFSVLSVNKGLGVYKLGKYSIYPGFHSTPLVEVAVNTEDWNKISMQSQAIIKQSILELADNTLMVTQQDDADALVALNADADADVTVISLPDAEVQKFHQIAKDEWDKQATQSKEAKLVYDTVTEYRKNQGL